MALQWFKHQMDLLPPAGAQRGFRLWGMSAFHATVMGILILFMAAMIWMYFFKMRRASERLQRLATAPDAARHMPVAAPLSRSPIPSRGSAAVSCPDRTDEIFSGARIDEQLDSSIRGLLANPSKGFKLDRDRNVLKLSWILQADRRLFGGTRQGVLQFVHRYAPADVVKWMDEHEDALTIPEYRHPPTNSMDCAQCHQAPPSHSMQHFNMISQEVAGRPHARVDQCFQCHQTTSWNDIQGAGWYKHH